jgi:hypothetical protein
MHRHVAYLHSMQHHELHARPTSTQGLLCLSPTTELHKSWQALHTTTSDKLRNLTTNFIPLPANQHAGANTA